MASTVVIKDGLHTGADPATPTIGVVTAEDARVSNGAGFARLAAGLTVRTGVLYHGVQTLIYGTATTAPSMSVAVAPLAVVAQKASTEGVYVPTSTATALLDIAAAPGTNSRIDVVYAMQRDAGSATAPDSVTQGELGVVTGNAAVSPTKPAIPVGAVEIGTVTVAAGATATTNASVTIATTCRWTVPLGAAIPVRTQVERDAIAAFAGLTVDRLDQGRTERWSGTAWVQTQGVTPYVRVRQPVDGGNYGSQTWTNQGSWVVDGAIRGPAGYFTVSGGQTTVQRDGLYHLGLAVTAVPVSGSPGLQARLWTNAGRVYVVEWSMGGSSFIVSASAVVWLTAGTTLIAAVYNAAGLLQVRADTAASYPTAYTVTRLSD